MINLEKDLKRFKKCKNEIDKAIYKRRLLQKALTIFEWEGAEIDSRLLNYALFTQGACGITKKDEQYIVILGRDGGYPLSIGYGEKLVGMDWSGKVSINAPAYWNDKISDKESCDGVICFNDTMGVGIYDIINRYAESLQIADVSIDIAMKNSRVSTIISASTKTAKDQIELALESIYDGKPKVYYDGAMANGLVDNPLNELLTNLRSQINMQDLIEMRSDIYSRYCIEIGIPVVNNTKRSQLISGEIGGINTLSLVNLKDMLERRQEFCKRFNELYDENLSVRIADEYLIESLDQNGGMNGGSNGDEKPAAGTDAGASVQNEDKNKEGDE